MGCVEDSNLIDMMMDEIGFVLTKADETIQKSIELWSELTKDLFIDQSTQDSTGQSNICEEHCSQDKHVPEVKEEPVRHWAMCLAELKDESIQHCASCVTKVPETLIQEVRDEDNDYGHDDDDDWDDNFDNEEDEEERAFESRGESSWYDWDNWDGDANDDDYHHQEEDDETTVSESCENMSEINLGSWYHHYLIQKDVGTVSKDAVESWDDDDQEEEKEEESIVSESFDNMSEINLGSWYHHYLNQKDVGTPSKEEEEDDDHEEDESTTSEFNGNMFCYSPSVYHYHNEEDMGSSLKQRDVDTSSQEEEDDGFEVWECESLVAHDHEDEVGDKLEGFVNVKEEESSNSKELGEVKTLFPQCDWVYVTRD